MSYGGHCTVLYCTMEQVRVCIPLLDKVKREVNRISGRKREEVVGDWRRLHNEERNNLYASPNIIRVTKSKRMRWVGNEAYMRDTRMHTIF